MPNLVSSLGRLMGYHFTPDNTVVPVMRLGLFHHLAGPGRFHVKPSLERTLEPIVVGVRTGRYTLTEVMSRDNIAFKINVVVRFSYDPRQALTREIQSRIIHAPDAAWHALVEDRTSQAIRRVASAYEAEMLTGRAALRDLEKSTTCFLSAELQAIGITVAKNAVIIKEVYAPDKFKQTMLQVRQHQAVIAALEASQGQGNQPQLVEQALRAEFMTSLEGHPGNLTIFSPFDSLLHTQTQAQTRPRGEVETMPIHFVNGQVQGD